MALSHAAFFLFSEILWILLLLGDGSSGKKTTKYYMDSGDCGNVKYLGGATVFSHKSHGKRHSKYKHGINCKIIFNAENKGWKLKLDVVQLDIPDMDSSSVCLDALYVYDSDTVLKGPVPEAGNNNGLCGRKKPDTIYSTGPFLTIMFSTNKKHPRGRGFKLIITAFSEDYKKDRSCGANFVCNTTKLCISEDLKCDSVNHCGDRSDESHAAAGCVKKVKKNKGGSKKTKTKSNEEKKKNKKGKKSASSNPEPEGFFDKILSLGVAAAVGIFIGAATVVIGICIAVFCCCRRCRQKAEQRRNDRKAVRVPQNVAGNPKEKQRPFSNHDYSPQGYMAMHPQQPMYPQPIYPQQVDKMYSSPYQQHMYGHSSQESTSGISSQHGSNPVKHQHNRCYTPTSSKSENRSQRSNSDVTYTTNNDTVIMPVNL